MNLTPPWDGKERVDDAGRDVLGVPADSPQPGAEDLLLTEDGGARAPGLDSASTVDASSATMDAGPVDVSASGGDARWGVDLATESHAEIGNPGDSAADVPIGGPDGKSDDARDVPSDFGVPSDVSVSADRLVCADLVTLDQGGLDATAVTLLDSAQAGDVDGGVDRTDDGGVDLELGLVGHWAFDEGSGAAAGDSSGNGILGTLLNEPIWSSDCAPVRRGHANPGCLHLDGTKQSVLLADADVANFTGPITISIWVKTDAIKLGSTHMYLRDLVARGPTSNPNAEILLRLQNTTYSGGSYDGTAHQTYSDTSADDVGVWVHLAMVYDGAAWRFYRKGILTESTVDAVGAIPVSAPWSFGANSEGTGRFYNGSIDDVRLYNRGLSAAEIAELAAGI